MNLQKKRFRQSYIAFAGCFNGSKCQITCLFLMHVKTEEWCIVVLLYIHKKKLYENRKAIYIVPKNVCIFIFVRLFHTPFSSTVFFCMFTTPGGYLKHIYYSLPQTHYALMMEIMKKMMMSNFGNMCICAPSKRH